MTAASERPNSGAASSLRLRSAQITRHGWSASLDPEDGPVGLPVQIGAPAERALMPGQMGERLARQRGQRRSALIVSPDDRVRRGRGEGPDVQTPHYRANQGLRLDVAGRIEKGGIEPGFDAEADAEPLAQGGVIRPSPGQGIASGIGPEHPQTSSQRRLEGPLGRSALEGSAARRRRHLFAGRGAPSRPGDPEAGPSDGRSAPADTPWPERHRDGFGRGRPRSGWWCGGPDRPGRRPRNPR